MLDPDDFNGLEVAGLRFFATRNRNLGSEKNYNNIFTYLWIDTLTKPHH